MDAWLHNTRDGHEGGGRRESGPVLVPCLRRDVPVLRPVFLRIPQGRDARVVVFGLAPSPGGVQGYVSYPTGAVRRTTSESADRRTVTRAIPIPIPTAALAAPQMTHRVVILVILTTRTRMTQARSPDHPARGGCAWGPWRAHSCPARTHLPRP